MNWRRIDLNCVFLIGSGIVIGIVAYVFILGRLEPIADPPAA